MSYKSIVVQLDMSARAQPRLEYALRLALQFDAHLTGVFSAFSPDPRSFYVMAGTADYYEEHRKTRQQRHGALERIFHAELLRAGVRGQWIDYPDSAGEAIPRYARYADLVVAGQDDPDDPEAFISDHFPETLVMTSGRPVLFIPYTGVFPTLGANIMVAWNGSRESARAVHDAMPLLQRAEKVTVVRLNESKDEQGANRIPGADIALLLARHDVKAEVAAIDDINDVPMGDMLLTGAADLGADLIVMGAYGHSRWQELVMGGATRTMLASMPIPVLMSH
ncbi:Universal stress protein family protein (plasmid) [Caballeronia sp. SBC1]|uniref:universal stress protein n=1 Tax=unclassified Caballeronia TaxID=2646786 RepID=UPI0013E1F397|nr:MULTISPECIES: universal stress protein [unclassified Caballeronia]QIE25588.1 Universal stress protein family protein [Caballeronia sp. SBC2]QIN65100.1 Universal stress protein family protein [Caballeronia sp. SBC1]